MSENVFKTVYKQGYDYFTDNLARIVLFYALCAVVGFVFLAAIIPSTGMSVAMILSMIVAIGATAYDSWEYRKKFKARIEATEKDYFTRIAESSSEKAAIEAEGVFGPKEKAQIKKQLRDSLIVVVTKLVFLAILVVLLFSML